MTRSLSLSLMLLSFSACGGEVTFPNVEEGPEPEMAPDVDGPEAPAPETPAPDVPAPDTPMPDPEPSAPPPALDRQLFVDVVSAALSPCSLAPTCHLGPDGAFGQDFGFFPNTDSPAEIDANLAEVAAFLNLDDPAASAILVRGRDNHNDLILDDTQYCAIFDWIYAAVPEPAPMCTPP